MMKRVGVTFYAYIKTIQKKLFVVGKSNRLRIDCIGNKMKAWINHIAAEYLKDSLDKTGVIDL